jgi:hypothetical protein
VNLVKRSLSSVYHRSPASARPILSRAWNSVLRLARAAADRWDSSTTRRRLDRGPTDLPRVSVVIPAKDEQEHLRTCLESVAAQMLPNVEIIVIDDGSRDLTLDVAMDYAAEDDRTVVLHHTESLGLSAARNTGLEVAGGEYVTFLDADDYLFPGSLRARVAKLARSERTTVVGVYCDWEPVPDRRARKPSRRARRLPAVSYLESAGRPPFIASAPVLRTEVVRSFGGFDESMRSAEDFDLWARLMRHGFVFEAVDHVGVAYRQRREGMVQGRPADHAEAVIRVMDWMDRALRDDEVVPGTPAVFRQPLGTELATARRNERLTHSLALAVATGDADQIGRVLRLLDDLAGPVPPAAAGTWARSAMNRVRVADPTLSEESIAAIVDRTIELLTSHATPAPVETPASRPTAERRRDRSWMRITEPEIERADAPGSGFGGIVFAPMAPYHLDEMAPVADELARRDVRASYLLVGVGDHPVARAFRRRGDPVYSLPADLGGLPSFEALVTMNDWSIPPPLMAWAHERDIPVVAKVEGVQDWDDVDTGRVRRPYRHADVVLGQGRNDADALGLADEEIVGSTRLEQLWLAPRREFRRRGAPLAVINSNFTYRVYTTERDSWLRAALDACGRAGLEPIISQHLADPHLRSDLPISPRPMRWLLGRADVLISRFSTVPFEAMATGVPFVYFNPHGERATTFNVDSDAFARVSDASALPDAIREALSWRGGYRERAEAFFAQQIDIRPDRSAAIRTADAVERAVGARR